MGVGPFFDRLGFEGSGFRVYSLKPYALNPEP